MASFMVKLQSTVNGRLDINPTTGMPFTTSVGRTLYMQDNNLERVILNDGDLIEADDEDAEDYWAQFVYVPGSDVVTQSLENAFLVQVD